MCGRYTLHTTDELEERYRVEVSEAIRPNYNVAPSQMMPVILHPDDEAQWLAADTEEDIRVLLTPLESGVLETFEVSPDVNTVRVNNETLMAVC